MEDQEVEDVDTRRLQLIKELGLAHQFLLMSQFHLTNAYHYIRYVHKVPCYDGKLSGYDWMMEHINSESDVRSLHDFRMETHVLLELCHELQNNYGLVASKNVSVLEKVGIFLFTLAIDQSNRDVSEQFQRSGDTISRVFHEVLDCIVGRHKGFNGFAKVLLEPRDRTFAHVPQKIVDEERYSAFQGAIGCIDGVHIQCCIPERDQIPYFGRKKFCSFNVMAVCDFDMYFIFILSGWEGSAHDAKVFDHATRTLSMNFPHPPEGRYYLCDKGYPDKQGFLVPYAKVNYHRSQFGRTPPRNQREGFNRLHSSLRTTIERCFGVMKKRWKILRGMPSYSVDTQIDITIACFALHNFILAHKRHDKWFDKKIDLSKFYNSHEEEPNNPSQGMGNLRDRLGPLIWENKAAWLFRST